MLRCLALVGVVVLGLWGCGRTPDGRDPAQGALAAALGAGPLAPGRARGGGAFLPEGGELVYRSIGRSAPRGAGPGIAPASGAGATGARFEARVERGRSRLSVARAGAAGITLTPAALPARFGAAEIRGGAVVYLAAGAQAALTLTPRPDGVKEDILLARPLADGLDLEWTLALGPGLEARLTAAGDIDVARRAAGARPAPQVLYRLPAPVVRDATGGAVAGAARFELAGARVRLVARGLARLAYPVSIDPTVIVTTTADFDARGNNEGGVDTAGDQLTRDTAVAGVWPWVTGTTTGPGYRTNHAITAANGYLYVSGGDSGAGLLADNWVGRLNADGTVGPWHGLTPLPTARSRHTLVAVNNYLFALGGWDGATRLNQVLRAQVSSDGQIGPWTTLTAAWSPRMGHASVAFNNFVYVAGGDAGSVVNEAWVGTVDASGAVAWAPSAAFTTARSFAALALASGRLYLTGGITSSGAANDYAQRATINATDGSLSGWSFETNLPGVRGRHTSVAANGTLYVLGGWSGTSYLGDVIKVPINADGSLGASWTGTAGLTAPRAGHASVAAGGYLQTVGGTDSVYPLRDVQSAAVNADGTLEVWQATSFSARTSHATVVSGSHVYVIGGGRGGLVLDDALVAPLNADGTVGRWSTTSSMPRVRREHTAVVANGYVFAIGGSDGSFPIGYIDAAPVNGDGTLGPWQQTRFLNYPVRGHGSVVVGGRLYVIGGTSGAALSSIIYATIGAGGALSPWSTATQSLPAARTGLAAVANNGFIYVLGGYVGASPTNDVLYAPVFGTGNLGNWDNTSPRFTTARSATGAFAVNNRLYVLGGAAAGAGAYLADVQLASLDPSGAVNAAGWQATTALPGNRGAHTAAVANGFAYVLGGASGAAAGNLLDDVAAAPLLPDGTLGSWDRSARQRGGAAVYRGNVYLVGGETMAAEQLADVRVMRITSVGWLGAPAATTPLPTARTAVASVAYNGYLYAIGGRSGATDLAEVRYANINADGTLGAWAATSAPLPAPRSGLSAVAHRGTLYVFGAGGTSWYYGRLGATGDVAAWTAGPTATPTNGATAVAYDGAVYLMGPTMYSAPVNPDGSLGAFTALGAAPGGRTQYPAAAFNGAMFVFGGQTGAGAVATVLWAPIVGPGALGPWQMTASLPAPLRNESPIVYQGYAYLVGGDDGASPFDRVYTAALVRSPVAPGAPSTWTAGTNLGPSGTMIADHAAVALNGYVYALGGIDIMGPTAVATVWYAKLNPAGNVDATGWQPTTPLPQTRYYHGALAYNGRIYVVGGSGAQSQHTWVATPDPATGAIAAWDTTMVADLPVLRTSASAALWNGRIYVSGGWVGTSAARDVLVGAIDAQGRIAGWQSQSPGGDLPSGRAQHQSVAHDGYLYVLGGCELSACNGVSRPFTNKVSYAPIYADGTLGSWSDTSAFNTPRWRHGVGVRHGYVYLQGGYTRDWSPFNWPYMLPDAWYAPLRADGSVGAWSASPSLPTTWSGHVAVFADQRLYVVGGEQYGGANLQYAGVQTPVARASYSKLIDLGPNITQLGTITTDGDAARWGTVALEVAVAPASGVFGPIVAKGVVPLGAPVALGDVNPRYLWVRYLLDDTFAVVPDPAASNAREVLDFVIDDRDRCTGVVCTAQDQCHSAGTCDPATGLCANPVRTGGACDDGNPCTYNDVCDATGACAGTAITCTGDACHTRACNGTASCSVTINTGASCDDGNACTYSDVCDATGACAGTIITCTSDACHTRACNGTASCGVTINTGASCDDGNACTYND
ncbi:MAG TPA: hypothetical protein VGQ83_31725, partial [Polyangia bacterium]